MSDSWSGDCLSNIAIGAASVELKRYQGRSTWFREV